MKARAVELLYQDIGQSAVAIAQDFAGKLLIYADVEDGVISADMFYVPNVGPVRFRFCPSDLKQLVYSLWTEWKAIPGNKEWRTMSYVVDGGKFSIELQYPDQVDPEELASDRRLMAVRKHFGDIKVDYSRP